MKFRIVLIFWFYSYSISTVDSKKSGSSGGRGGNENASPNVGSRPLGNTGGAPAGNLGGSSFGGGTAGAGKKGGFLSSPTSKVVAAGLAGVAVGAGGYALINAASGSHYYPEYQRTYYYGDRYYSPSGSASKLVCRYKIDDGDSGFKDMFYEDKTKITEIIYECDTRTETCCDGLDCCKRKDLQQRPAVVVTERRGVPWWGGLLIFIMFVAIFGLVGFCIYSRIKRRKAVNSLQPDVTYVVESVQNPQDAYGYPAQTQSQGYPAQNQTPYYPPQPGYPQQQYAPPPAPGYPVGQQPYPQMGQPFSNGQQQNFGQPYPPQQQQYH